MKIEVDKQRCLANINYLMKQRGIKIGDLEKSMDISSGYISRLSKEENNTKISVDFLATVADALSTSMDVLVGCDLEAASPTDQYIGEFLEKLKRKTLDGTLTWDKESVGVFDNLIQYQDGTTSHPLFHCDDRSLFYNSYFADKRGTKPSGEFYTTTINVGTHIYLTRVQYPGNSRDDYEIYFVSDMNSPSEKVEPVCCTNPKQESIFDKILFQLYSAVAASCRNVKVNENVRKAIDFFMEDKGIFDDVLPF